MNCKWIVLDAKLGSDLAYMSVMKEYQAYNCLAKYMQSMTSVINKLELLKSAD